MIKIRLLILVKDLKYASALAAFLSCESKEFDICIEDPDNISSNTTEEFHIALADEVLSEKAEKYLSKTKWRITLTEDTNCTSHNPKNQMSEQIFKYLPGPEIAKEIRFTYALLTGRGKLLRRDRTTLMIGFISGAAGTGKTVISIALARDLSKRYDKKVLYISLDTFSYTDIYFGDTHNIKRTISDFLYFVFKDTENGKVIPPESFMHQDAHGVYAFCPGKAMNELCSLNTEEFDLFIKYIFDNGIFDYIIFDFNYGFSSGHQYLLQQCKEVFMIHGRGIVAQKKSKAFINYLKQLLDPGETINYKNVYNLGSVSWDDDQQGFSIEADNNSFYETDDMLEISLSSAFGTGIRAITEYVLRS